MAGSQSAECTGKPVRQANCENIQAPSLLGTTMEDDLESVFVTVESAGTTIF